jgi:hypothetical protein
MAQVELAGGIPFVSDKDLATALDNAYVAPQTAAAVVQENSNARIAGLRTSLSLLAIVALIALFLTRKIPTEQPGAHAKTKTPPTREPAFDVHRPGGAPE